MQATKCIYFLVHLHLFAPVLVASFRLPSFSSALFSSKASNVTHGVLVNSTLELTRYDGYAIVFETTEHLRAPVWNHQILATTDQRDPLRSSSFMITARRLLHGMMCTSRCGELRGM